MIAIVDSNYLCYKAMFAMTGTELSVDEIDTEVIFVFCKQLLKIARSFPIKKWAFAWDSRRSYRKKMYPEYKDNRRKKKSPEMEMLLEVAFPQFKQIRTELLPSLGFKNNFIYTGLEADDIIAKICEKYPDTGILIISSDNDLYQLLKPKVSMYNMKSLYTSKEFRHRYNISPDKWGMVKAIAGCSTDNVKGVAGVGATKAIKYLKGEMPERYKAFQNIKASKQIIERNKKLVILPFSTSFTVTLDKDNLKTYDFIKTFEHYKFKSFLNHKSLGSWEHTFNLT